MPPPGMRGDPFAEIVLVRHCESTANDALMKGNKAEQVADVELTEVGKQQAEHVRRVIEKLDGTVYCSPQRRAVMTAPEGTTIEHALRERNLKHDFALKSGGVSAKETPEEFRSRVDDYVQACYANTGVLERTIFVTHSLWIQEFLRILLKGDDFAHFHMGNGSITVVQFTEDEHKVRRAEIQMVGSVMHLPPDLRTGHHHWLYEVNHK